MPILTAKGGKSVAEKETPKWLSDEGKINEPLFCECFCEDRELQCIDGKFFSVNGAESEDKLCAEISGALTKNGITKAIAKQTDALYKALKLHCHSAPIVPREDEIHVLNGVLKVDGEIGKSPTFIPEKRFCVNRLNLEYHPEIWIKPPYYTTKFLTFLTELLEPKDIETLQEFMGYCLIPSTKEQAALFIVGNGGEGKSRLGVVLNDIFGSTMHSDSFQRIENDRFARYNLRGKLLMYDDDMQMEALKSTRIIKNLITAEIPVDIEAKGKQSQQAHIYCLRRQQLSASIV